MKQIETKKIIEKKPNRNKLIILYKYLMPKKKLFTLDTQVYNNQMVYLSIGAIFKNEKQYLKEWIEYHLLIGIERFYLYDNESTDNPLEVLEPYIKKGLVIYKQILGSAMQIPVYNDVISKSKNETKWLALIDLDEFIVPKETKKLKDFLKKYEKYPSLCINWINFDSNGFKSKPEGLVVENYTRVYLDDNHPENLHIKTILQPSQVLSCNNPHYAFYRNFKFGVNENYKKVFGPFTKQNSVKKIQINHYCSKSLEEYMVKLEKGHVDKINSTYKFSEENVNFIETKHDYSIYTYLEDLKNILGNANESIS